MAAKWTCHLKTVWFRDGSSCQKAYIEEWVKTKAIPSISPVWPSTYNSSAKYWPVHEVSDSEMFAACTTSAVTWEWPNLGDSMPSPSSDIPLHPTSRSPAFPNQESWQWNSSYEPPPPPCSTCMAVSSWQQYSATEVTQATWVEHTIPPRLEITSAKDGRFELQVFHPVQFGIMPRRLSTRQCDGDIIAVLEHHTSSIRNDYAARVVGDERTIRSRHMAMKGSAEPILRPAHGRKRRSAPTKRPI